MPCKRHLELLLMNKLVTTVELQNASLSLGGRQLWKDLCINIQAGEFIAVLGPTGAGKTSLLQVLLGLLPLDSGTALINNAAPRRGNDSIGYIPQQRSFDKSLPIRGRDLVQLGINGQRFGFSKLNSSDKVKINTVIDQVEAGSYADQPIGTLSGGEQQRLRIAQALVSQPSLLLCDEPLLSLDIAAQQSVTKLIHEYKENSGAAVVFVTHEINPILPWVDRILYMAKGKWIIDKPANVLQTKTLTELYGTPVDVLEVRGRVLVVGAEDTAPHEHHQSAEDHS
jgi:zinc/manganese transport system ATP-binding protein